MGINEKTSFLPSGESSFMITKNPVFDFSHIFIIVHAVIFVWVSLMSWKKEERWKFAIKDRPNLIGKKQRREVV